MASQRPKRGDKGTPKQTQESGTVPQAFDPTENVRPIRKNIAGNQIVIIPGTGIYEIEDRKTPEDIRRKKDDSKIFKDIQNLLKKEFKKSKKRQQTTDKILKDNSTKGVEAVESSSDATSKKDKKPPKPKDDDVKDSKEGKGFFKKAKEVLTGKTTEGAEAKAKTRLGAAGISMVKDVREGIGEVMSPFTDLPIIKQVITAGSMFMKHGQEQRKQDTKDNQEKLKQNRGERQAVQAEIDSITEAAKQFEVTYEKMTPGGTETKTKTVEASSQEEALGMLDITQKPKGIEQISTDDDSSSLNEQLEELIKEEAELESMLKDAHGVHSPGYLHDIVNLQTQVLDNSKKLLTKDADRKLKSKEDKNEKRRLGLFAKRDKDGKKRQEGGSGGFFSSIMGMVTGVVSIAAILKKPKLLFKHLLKKIPGSKAIKEAWKLAFKNAGTAWANLGSTIWKGISGLGSTISKGLQGLGTMLSSASTKAAATAAKTATQAGVAGAAGAAESGGGGNWLSRGWKKVKSIGSSAVSGVVSGARAVGGAVSTGARAVGGAVSNVAGKVWEGAKSAGSLVKKGGKWVVTKTGELILEPVKKLFKSGGAKMFGRLVKGIPILTTLLEAIFAHQDIKEIIANPDMTRGEKEQAVGRRASGMLGAIIGTALGGMAGTLIPIPVLGTLVGAVGGAWAGEWLGGLVADVVGAKPIGKVLMDHVYDKMPNKDDGMQTAIAGVGTVVKPLVAGQGQVAHKMPRAGLITNGGGGGVGPALISSTATPTTSGGILTATNAGLHNNQSSNMSGGGGSMVAVNSPTTTTTNNTNNNISSGKGDSRMDEGAFNTERRDANNNSMF